MGIVTVIKVALLGGTIYLTRKLGIWEEPDVTVLLYEDVKCQLKPYAMSIKQRFCCKPCEECNLPDPPPSWRESWACAWNAGVKKAFGAIERVPEYCEHFSLDVQQSIRKFLKTDATKSKDAKK